MANLTPAEKYYRMLAERKYKKDTGKEVSSAEMTGVPSGAPTVVSDKVTTKDNNNSNQPNNGGDFFSAIGYWFHNNFNKMMELSENIIDAPQKWIADATGNDEYKKWLEQDWYDYDSADKWYNPQEGSVLKTVMDFDEYIGKKFVEGAGGALEGVADYVAGGVAEITGNHETAERLMKSDLSGRGNADIEFADSVANNEVVKTVGDVMSGIGGMLPAVAISTIPGVGPTLGKVAFATGAAGQATSEKARKSGELRANEWLYGTASGAIEGAIESISGGIGGVAAGSVFGKKVASSLLGKVATGFIGEGLEEVASDAINPVLESVTGLEDWETIGERYVGKDGVVSQLPNTFLVGGLTGMVMGGTSTMAKVSEMGTLGAYQASELADQIRAINMQLNEEGASGKLTEKKRNALIEHRNLLIEKYNEKMSSLKGKKIGKNEDGSEKYLTVEEQQERIFRENPQARGYVYSQQDGNVKRNENAMSESLRERKNLVLEYEPTTKELTQEQEDAIRNGIKLTNGKVDIVITDGLSDNENGVYQNGIIYINSKANAPMVHMAHEITHSLEGTEEYEALKNFIIENDEVVGGRNFEIALKRKLQAYSGVNTGLSEETKIYEATTELIAEAIGRYCSTQNSVNRIVKKNKNLAIRIYEWIKEKLSGKGLPRALNAYYSKVEKLFAKALASEGYRIESLEDVEEMVKEQKSKEQKQTPQASGQLATARFSIQTDSEGREFVQADRRVIFGTDVQTWKTQITTYINDVIRQGRDIQIKTIEGDTLTITRNTAGKATFQNKGFSNEEFRVKLNAEAHIDELAKISKAKKNLDGTKKITPDYDEKHAKRNIAKDGWSYRNAYFRDFDGKFYKITLSVAIDGTVQSIYNVGAIKEKHQPGESRLTTQRSADVSTTIIHEKSEKSTDFSKKIKKGDTSRKSLAENGVDLPKKGVMRYNLNTYNNGGRSLLEERLKTMEYSSSDIKIALRTMDELAKFMQEMGTTYKDVADWNNATVYYDENGKAIYSAMVTNGDYKLNIDLSTICRKRKALTRVLNELVKRNLIDNVNLSQENIVKINEILRESNYEVACPACFVETKRYRIDSWAKDFIDAWNKVIEDLPIVDIETLDFTNGKKSVFNATNIDTSTVEEGIKNGKYGGRENTNIAKLILNTPYLRGYLRKSDLIGTKGLDIIKKVSPELYQRILNKKGSATPKIMRDFQPYDSELSVIEGLAEQAQTVGGVRMFSFSDFTIEQIFDYLQVVADLYSQKATMHTYTKVISFAKIFGKTGIKINLSMIPQVDKKVSRDNAGLDAEGNLLWSEFGVNYDEAVDLMLQDGYSQNVGTTTIGISDNHIRRLLANKYTNYIIPYHRSGINKLVAQMNDIDYYKDYTLQQRTRYRKKGVGIDIKYADGRSVIHPKDGQGKAVSAKEEFNFFESLQRLKDAKAMAREYLEWCDKNGYIPKFEQFSGDKNYYKLLVDFRVYDAITGKAVPQKPVTLTYPDNLKDIISKEIKAQAEMSESEDLRFEKTFAKIVDVIDKRKTARHSLVSDIEPASIDKYSEKEYNRVGWARVNGILSMRENADLRSKYARLKSGQLKGIPKNKDGEYIIAVNDGTDVAFGVDNVLVYAKGPYYDYKITKVVRINLDNETAIDIVRSEIYEISGRRTQYTYQESKAFEAYFGEELVSEYQRNDCPTYQESKAERKGQESRRDSGQDYLDNQHEQDGRRDVKKDSRTGRWSIEPITISSDNLPKAQTYLDEKEGSKVDKKEARRKGWVKTQIQLTNRQAGIEAYGRELGIGREIEELVQRARNTTARGEGMLFATQIDREGKEVGKALYDIFKEFKKDEDLYSFYEYLLHMHNIDRVSLEANAKKKIATNQTRINELLKSKNANGETLGGLLEKADEKARKGILAAFTEVGEEYSRLVAENEKLSEVKNKPVFGFKNTVEGREAQYYTAEESKKIANDLATKNPTFVEKAKEVWKYNDNLLQRQADAGLISKETLDYYRKTYPHYVPTYRDMEGEKRSVGVASSGLQSNDYEVRIRNGQKTATGSSRDILDIQTMMARQTMAVMRAETSNDLAVRLFNESRSAYEKNITATDEDKTPIRMYNEQAFEVDEEGGLDGAEIVYTMLSDNINSNKLVFFIDGKATAVEIDEDIAEGFKSFIGKKMDNVIVNFASKIMNVFKRLVTEWNPLFTVRNFIRDIQESFVHLYFTGKSPAYKGKFLKNLGVAFNHIFKGNKAWKIYQAQGGSGSGMYNHDLGIYNKPSKNPFVLLGKGIGWLNSTIEQVPRYAAYLTSVETGESVDSAILNSAEITTNFSRSGKTVSLLGRTLIPFLNASVQGFSKIWRTAAGRKGFKGYLTFVVNATVVGLSTYMINELIAMLLYNDEDKERYESLNRRDKENNYILSMGNGNFLKIPKGRLNAALSSIGRLYERFVKGDEKAFDGWYESVSSAISPIDTATRTILSPVFDVASNTTWYGGEIESAKFDSVRPSERYDESTSSIAITIGKVIDYSPKKIHYLIDQYTGVVGDIILPMTTKKAENDPVSNAFVIDSDLSNAYATNFYDLIEEMTYDKSSGDAVAALKLRYLNKVSSVASELYQKKRDIANSDLSDADKIKQTEAVQVLLNETFRSALLQVEELEQSIIDGGYEQTLSAVSESKDYMALDEETQSKIVSKINEYYYAKAFAEVSGNGYSEIKYYLYDAFPMQDLSVYLTKISSLESDKDRNGKAVSGSRKVKVERYVSGLRLTATQKYLLMVLAGYALSDKGKTKVRAYIRSIRGLDSTTKKILYEEYA